jgi:DNA-binding LacI/PurR family transcriptional regulator
MGTRMTSVRKIAELAGVAISTVSLVMNDKPGVSERTRQTVRDAIRQLEAQQPADGRETRTLSIVVLHPPVLSSYYVFSQVLQGIQAAAETHRLRLSLVANDPNASKQHISHLYLSDPNLRPDGVLIFGARRHEPLIGAAQQAGIPCVVLGRDAEKYAVSGLGRREDEIACKAAHYLIDLGHRAIGFVGGEEIFDYVHNRLKGYRRALQEAEIASSPNWICLGGGTSATKTVLERAPEVTALMFVNDSFAADGLKVIAQRKLAIPGDLSVLSFDDTDFALSYRPPLTSVAYNFFEEGEWAVRMLLDEIRNPYIEAVHTFFAGGLVERESCAPPRK